MGRRFQRRNKAEAPCVCAERPDDSTRKTGKPYYAAVAQYDMVGVMKLIERTLEFGIIGLFNPQCPGQLADLDRLVVGVLQKLDDFLFIYFPHDSSSVTRLS